LGEIPESTIGRAGSQASWAALQWRLGLSRAGALDETLYSSDFRPGRHYK